MGEPTTSDGGLRDELLVAAEKEIEGQGIDAVSLRAIARQVGVSHQAPGHHFGDRRGLLTALATDAFRNLAQQMRTARGQISDDAPPAERVATVGTGYMIFARQHPGQFAVMHRPELIDSSNPELTQARADALGVLMVEISSARRTGWGRNHSETALAITCWSAVHGAISLWRDGTLRTFFPDLDGIEAATHVVTETLNSGLAAEAEQTGRP